MGHRKMCDWDILFEAVSKLGENEKGYTSVTNMSIPEYLNILLSWI